jgi:hypothetical protein
MMLTDWFPVGFTSSNGHSHDLFHSIPKVLKEYWQKHTWETVRRSECAVVFLVGGPSWQMYENELKRDGINYERVAAPIDYKTDGPLTYLEKNEEEKRTVRITLVGLHPECFQCTRAFNVTPIQRGLALCERLLDMASIYLNRELCRPVFLSSMAYFEQHHTNHFIRIDAFGAFANRDRRRRSSRTQIIGKAWIQH